MNIFIFCLTLLVCYGIIRIAYKAWQRVDVKERMEEIKETNRTVYEIEKFKAENKGDLESQKQTIEEFTKEKE